MAGQFFKKYYSRLAKEAILKSLVCALIVGFSALLLSAAAFYFFAGRLFWISFIIFAVCVGGTFPIFYFKKFRPNKKQVAKRIDDLGLEERVLTMTELEGDDSYIAKMQRADTVSAISRLNASMIKIIVSVPLIIALSCVGVAGAGMATVSSLAAAGVIKPGDELIEDFVEPDPVFYTVTYLVEGDGYVVGVTDDAGEEQLVEAGKDSLPVTAIAEEGWMFIGWQEDENTSETRFEKDVKKDLTFTALFEEAEYGEPGEGEEGEGEEGDSDDAQPSDPSSGDGDTTNGGEENENEGDNNAAGGAYQPNNQVIDGNTYYGDIYADKSEEIKDSMNADGDLTDEDRDLFNDYWNAIKVPDRKNP